MRQRRNNTLTRGTQKAVCNTKCIEYWREPCVICPKRFARGDGPMLYLNFDIRMSATHVWISRQQRHVSNVLHFPTSVCAYSFLVRCLVSARHAWCYIRRMRGEICPAIWHLILKALLLPMMSVAIVLAKSIACSNK